MKHTHSKPIGIFLAVILFLTTILQPLDRPLAAVVKTNADEKYTFTVHVKRPPNYATGSAISYGSTAPYLYAYSRVSPNQTVDVNGSYPGTEMTYEATEHDSINNWDWTWYQYTFTAPTKEVRIFIYAGVSEVWRVDEEKSTEDKTVYVKDDDGNIIIDYTPTYAFPDDGALDGKDHGFLISSDVWFDPITMKEPTTENLTILPTPTITATPEITPTPTTVVDPTPEITPTPVVTEEPVVLPTTEPVNGPQALVSSESGTSYYEENSDALNLTVTPVNGATSAEVSIDDGPVSTITKETNFKVGTAKLANSMITMTVTSTNGTQTNTQHFYYYKRSKVETPSQAQQHTLQLSSMMVYALHTVKTLANDKTYHVTFTIPDESKLEEKDKKWTAKDSQVYAYAYYHAYGQSASSELFGSWPGKPMTPVEGKKGTYSIDVTTSTDTVNMLFACVRKVSDPKKGEYLETIAQFPSAKAGEDAGSYQVTGSRDFYGDNMDASPTPTTLTTSPSVSDTPRPVDTPVVVTNTPDVTTPVVSETPGPTPTSTPIITIPPIVTAEPNTLCGYFGATLSAPQYTTTKIQLKTIAKHAQGKVTYTYAINGSVVAESTNPTFTWDPSKLPAGNYTLTVIVTDKTTNKSIVLDKVYPLVKKTEQGDITPEPIIPTETPVVITATPEITATPDVVTTSPIVATPTALATTLPTTSPTLTPVTTPTITAAPTPTVPTTTVTADPISDSLATTIPATATPAPYGVISFSKASGKGFVGDTLVVKYTMKNESPTEDYTYTYEVSSGSDTTTLKEYTATDKATWSPTKAGTYKVTVYAYNEAKEEVCTTSTTYKVLKQTITFRSFKPTSIKNKKTAKLVVRATVSSGTLYTRLVIKNTKGKVVKAKAYSKANSLKWKPKKKGTYTVVIYLKNGKGAQLTYTKKLKVK